MIERPAADRLPSGSTETDRLEERRLRLVVEHSRALRWQMTSIMVVIAGVAWTGVPPALVLLWLAAAILVREARAAALVRMLDSDATPIRLRIQHTQRWTLALGLTHGSAAVFMLSLSTAFDAILTMILMCLASGAVSTTAALLRAFVAYAAAITVPIAALWFVSGGLFGWSIGVLVLMFLGVQITFARKSAQAFEESYAIRLENVELLRQLTEERTLIAVARDAAVQANESKSRFLAAASHDLRQPLQSLSLNIGALARMPLDADSKLVTDEIAQSVDALRQMLDALLDISTLDSGGVKPTFRQIPLDRLLEAICAGFRAAAAAKGLRFHCDCPSGIAVTSDAGMLRRVVSNLIDNAIKYTDQGGVSLAVGLQDDRIRLTVSDTGVGIQSADQARVFEDLTQLGNAERNRAFGHGLGLGIVRRLCQLLGIAYGMESGMGDGTRFHLDLPGGEGAATPNADAVGLQPQLISRRVLVLDDDPAVRTAYGHALRSLGCQVTCSATLGEALARAALCDPELALVDYRLAQNDNGLDAVRRLRQLRPALAALIVSADMTSELREGAARESIPLLRKPVTDILLAAAIHRALHDATPQHSAQLSTPGA